MPQHKLALASISLMALPGLLIAGYPDVPRSHWASTAVDKLGQAGVMNSRSDGRFHGDKAATRYEVAQAVAKAMAEFENRLVSEGKSPEDIVPYIERINLYVADEIDQLKQSQKELRATLNEVLERLERREAHSTPMPPPAPPMAHPHASTTPHTELRASTREVHEQRIHPTEGAATVNTHTYEAVTKAKKRRTSSGRISAVEGAIEIKGSETADEGPVVTESPFGPAAAQPAPAKPAASTQSAAPAKPAATVAAAPAAPAAPAAATETKKWPSDEAAWDNVPTSAKDEEDAAMLDGMEVDATPKAAPKGTKVSKGKSKSSKPSVPRAAPVNTSSTPKVDAQHAGTVLPEPKKSSKKPGKKETKATRTEVKITGNSVTKTDKPATKADGIHEDEIFESPEIQAGTGEPSDEQLANWKPDTAKPAAATPAVTAKTQPTEAKSDAKGDAKGTRTAKVSSILSELRSRAHK